MPDTTETLEQLALRRAALVHALWSALEASLETVRAEGLRLLEERSKSLTEEGMTTSHSGSNKGRGIVTLYVGSATADADKKRRHVYVYVDWRADEEGCVIRCTTMPQSSGVAVSWADVRSRALAAIDEASPALEHLAPKGASSQYMWRSETRWATPDDLAPVETHITAHLDTLPALLDAYRACCQERLAARAQDPAAP